MLLSISAKVKGIVQKSKRKGEKVRGKILLPMGKRLRAGLRTPPKGFSKTFQSLGRNVPRFLEGGRQPRIAASGTGGKRFTEHSEKVHRSFAKSTKNFSRNFIELFQKPSQRFSNQQRTGGQGCRRARQKVSARILPVCRGIVVSLRHVYVSQPNTV